MTVNATSTAADPRPLLFAGLPATSWSFAVRTWLAVLLALYTAFWLELESPATSAITVAILAFPTRGQGLEKAGFRFFATIIGVTASIAIAGIFSQTSWLLLAVIGIWIGLCVYAAAMLDGNRGYAAALCGITVGLIAVQQIDSPLQVFPTGVARGAAIVVGILATALINDVLAAPDYHPVVLNRLEDLHRRVTEHFQAAGRGETISASMDASLLGDIASVRPDIASLATESSSGIFRSAAARSAMVDLVTELFLVRALAALRRATISIARPGNPDGGLLRLMTMSRAWLEEELVRTSADVRGNFDALREGTQPLRQWRSPLYRSRRIAMESGIRAAINFTLIAALFVMAGWPTTEVCLSLVAVIIAFGAAAPEPRLFTAVAVVATPIACLLAGILKYFVFNGVSEFQLLAIGLAPVVIGLALLMSLPNPLLASLGRLSLVFTFAVLAPSNPQSYDPTVFVITCLFACLASILVFAAQVMLPPPSKDRRLQLLVSEMRRDLSHSSLRRLRNLAPEEANFRDASRIQQIIMAGGGAAKADVFDNVMHCFDRNAAFRHCEAELDRLASGPLGDAAETARTALAQRNGAEFLAAAEALHGTADQRGLTANPACAALVMASVVFGRQPENEPIDERQS